MIVVIISAKLGETLKMPKVDIMTIRYRAMTSRAPSWNFSTRVSLIFPSSKCASCQLWSRHMNYLQRKVQAFKKRNRNFHSTIIILH